LDLFVNEFPPRAGAQATDPWYFLRYSDRIVTDSSIKRLFIFWMASQMGHIDRPIDGLQYALKTRAYTKIIFFLQILKVDKWMDGPMDGWMDY
jgi:hypothetical protein